MDTDSQMGKRAVILDVDAGVDDAFAILLALASPELEVLAITTVSGNVHETPPPGTSYVFFPSCPGENCRWWQRGRQHP